MNVLLANKFFWLKGGSESVFFNEKGMLENSGHNVIPFSMKYPNNEDSQYSSYFVSEVDYSKPGIINKISSAFKIIYSIEARNKMASLLQDYNIDIAHFHIFQHQISPSVFGPLRDRNIPIILTLHDLKPICPNYKMYTNGHICEECKAKKFYNCFKNRCTKGSALGSMINTIELYFHYFMGYYQNVDKYIAVSKFYRDKMIDFGFPEDNIIYLPNYIDTSQYNFPVTDDRYILYFGRLSEEKGLKTLIQAASLLPDVNFSIVGSGPLDDEIRSFAIKNKLSNVTFHGYKTGDELKRIVSACTCVVVPSEWYENCPMTILESFASSKPVIGSDIGGIPELIDQGVDGYIYEPANSELLSEVILSIWNNPDNAREMGVSGKNKIKKSFNYDSHYNALISIYNTLSGK